MDRRWTERTQQLAQMEEFLADASLPLEDRLHIGYALGKIYEDLGEYDAAQAASETLNLYSLPMQVLTIEGLLAAKRATGREKDKEAIVELEALLELKKGPPP
jgi:hypothetical protein